MQSYYFCYFKLFNSLSKKIILVIVSLLAFATICLAQPPCGRPPCGNGNGNGNGNGGGGGPPCFPPPCVPIDQGTWALLIIGTLYGAKKISQIKGVK